MTRATVKLVGQKAGGREHVVAIAEVGDPVLLVPEPDNQFDSNAVAVYHLPKSTLDDGSGWTSEDGWTLSDTARKVALDRQAGYVSRNLAARLDVPAEGIVGEVTDVRYAPPEYEPDDHGGMRPAPRRVAGFDFTADLPLRGARR